MGGSPKLTISGAAFHTLIPAAPANLEPGFRLHTEQLSRRDRARPCGCIAGAERSVSPGTARGGPSPRPHLPG